MHEDIHGETPVLPLLEYQESLRACGYLPGRSASHQYRFYESLSAETYQCLLDQGWRRFGRVVFRPRCPACQACRSLRVEVARFQLTRSQRRVLSRNADVIMRPQRATATPDHLQLFQAYHADMHRRKDWPLPAITLNDYAAEFADPQVTFGWEMLYYRKDRLEGIGLVDVLPRGLSSVYFFHAPEWRPLGPGTFSILTELSWAASLQKPYLYLGYWIADCPSMAYKARFQPHELLQTATSDGNSGFWRAMTPDAIG